MDSINNRPYEGADSGFVRFELTRERRRYLASIIGSVVVELKGKPDRKTSTELRYDNRKLVVNIAGRRAGTWHIFGSEEHGDTLALIQYLTGCDFKSAVEYVFGSRAIAPIQHVSESVPPVSETDTSEFARKTWSEAGSIEGTPAERYLINRGIPKETIQNLDRRGVVRFHPAHRSKPNAKYKAPALLLAATDLSGQVHAIQAIRVTADGQKAIGTWTDKDGAIHDRPVKLSCGLMKENGARLSKEWGSRAGQAMTGRMFQRLGNGDEVGFASGRNRDRRFEPQCRRAGDWGSK
jgi:hypothetical protein